MKRSYPVVSDVLLERYLLKELPPLRMQELRIQLESDPESQTRLDILRTSNTECLEKYPADTLLKALERRRLSQSMPIKIAQTKSFFPKLAFPSLQFSLPTLAVLTVSLMVFVRPDRQNEAVPNKVPTPLTDVRLKGAEAGLAIFRKTRTGTELLPPRTMARPGDTLQVFYHNKLAQYGMIFSVDGAGSITLHAPENGAQAMVLKIGIQIPLPHAFKLDKAPTLERFLLVTSPRPFDCEFILKQARLSLKPETQFADSLPGLDSDFRQYPYTIYKPTASKSKTPKAVGK